jgi:beta-ureidopropionase / N-carbamoyl-L-amino-acid hydrolase
MSQVISTQASMDLSSRIFKGFESHWKEGSGIWRPSYSPEENEAIQIVAREAFNLGMTLHQDLAGNAYFILKGKNPDMPVFMTGSHVDAVPQGGRYDGTAGVVAGLAAVKILLDEGFQAEQDIVVTIIRSEESAWFGSALLGSRLACGDVDYKILQKTRNDKVRKNGDVDISDPQDNLYSNMIRSGLSPAELESEMRGGHSLIPLDKIGAFVEVHIEQGPVLVTSHYNKLGVVTSIRGNTRCPSMIEFFGEAAHSGATPQYMRRDATLGAAKYITLLDSAFRRKEKAGADIVWSFPEIATPGGSSTTIPAFCTVRPEVRSTDTQVLEWAKRKIQQTTISVCSDLNLGWSDKNLDTIVISPPSQMTPRIVRQLEGLCQKFNFESVKLPSGAGHDAGTFARYGVPTGMIFIPHGNLGISHNPLEIMGLSDKDNPFSLTGGFARAVRLLAETMKGFPNTQNDPVNIRRDGRAFADGLSELRVA